MAKPDIQVQKNKPPTLVNSAWIKWADIRITELEQAMQLVVTIEQEISDCWEDSYSTIPRSLILARSAAIKAQAKLLKESL